MGRPPLGDEPRYRALCIRASEAEVQAIDEEAEKAGKSRSAFCLDIILRSVRSRTNRRKEAR